MKFNYGLAFVILVFCVLSGIFGFIIGLSMVGDEVVDLGESIVEKSGSVVGFNDSACGVVDGFVYCELDEVVCRVGGGLV